MGVPRLSLSVNSSIDNSHLQYIKAPSASASPYLQVSSSNSVTLPDSSETQKFIASSSSNNLSRSPSRNHLGDVEENDFDIRRTIGTGSFASVKLAVHKPTGTFVAIKSMKKSLLIQMKQIQHVRNERSILHSIRHPFIVNLLGTYQDDIYVHVIMDFVNGGELFHYLRKQEKFSLETTKFYAAQIVLALDYLHSHQICYRDLKPENLLLDHRGYLRICDFGFAKKVDDRTFTICGTPEYLAPEVIQNRGHSMAVDWWSLGILIYEMLAGFPPFSGETPYAIYSSILSNRLCFPRHFDAITRDLIKRLLTHDKSRRLGNLRAGARDVMAHKFFRGVQWKQIFTRQLPAPFVPKVRSIGDDSLFDFYSDPHAKEDAPIPPEAHSLFEGF
ncbi:hypothetical protein P9112_003147 [Eukaryota sp. TZLM1-RC]